MTQKQKQAIDLLIEDLHTPRYEIRNTAKGLGCEEELEEIKITLLDYLYQMKQLVK